MKPHGRQLSVGWSVGWSRKAESHTSMLLPKHLFHFILNWFQTNLKFLILLQPERLNVRRLSQLWSKELSSTNERLIKPRLSSVKLSPLHLKHWKIWIPFQKQSSHRKSILWMNADYRVSNQKIIDYWNMFTTNPVISLC